MIAIPRDITSLHIRLAVAACLRQASIQATTSPLHRNHRGRVGGGHVIEFSHSEDKGLANVPNLSTRRGLRDLSFVTASQQRSVGVMRFGIFTANPSRQHRL